MIQTLLDTCTRWEQDACSLLDDTEWLLNVENIDDEILSRRSKIEKHIQAIDSVVEAGQGLGFKFDMVPILQDACSALRGLYLLLLIFQHLSQDKFGDCGPTFYHVYNLQLVYCRN